MTYSQDNLEGGVLYMKGFVYGIPYIKLRESLLKAIEIINTHNIRILAWDKIEFLNIKFKNFK